MRRLWPILHRLRSFLTLRAPYRRLWRRLDAYLRHDVGQEPRPDCVPVRIRLGEDLLEARWAQHPLYLKLQLCADLPTDHAGEFGYSFGNGTLISNPWAGADNQHIAPFDKPFYLRMAVLTGGTDGYWMDNLPNKPWRNTDDRAQAMSRFWAWANVWLPTWPSGDKIRERAMAIDRVEVYQRRN